MKDSVKSLENLIKEVNDVDDEESKEELMEAWLEDYEETIKDNVFEELTSKQSTLERSISEAFTDFLETYI